MKISFSYGFDFIFLFANFRYGIKTVFTWDPRWNFVSLWKRMFSFYCRGNKLNFYEILTCVDVSFRVISFRGSECLYNITRNEISFLLKWPQWVSFRGISCMTRQRIENISFHFMAPKDCIIQSQYLLMGLFWNFAGDWDTSSKRNWH